MDFQLVDTEEVLLRCVVSGSVRGRALRALGPRPDIRLPREAAAPLTEGPADAAAFGTPAAAGEDRRATPAPTAMNKRMENPADNTNNNVRPLYEPPQNFTEGNKT